MEKQYTIIEDYKLVDREALARFVSSHRYGTIFQMPSIYEAYAATENMTPHIAIAMLGDRIVGSMISVTIKESERIGWLSSHTIINGGPITDENHPEVEKLLLDRCRHGIYTEQIPVFGKCTDNWHTKPHLNLYISLDKPVNELYKAIKQKRRGGIRHAESAGLTFAESTDYTTATRLIANTMRRNGIAFNTPSIFSNCASHAPANTRLLATYKDGRMVATQVMLCFNDLAYAWYLGSDRDTKGDRVDDYMIWKAIEWAKNNGYSRFDFGGGGNPEKKYGVRDFKMSFTPQSYNWGIAQKTHHPILMKICKEGYKLCKSLNLLST